MVGVVAFPFQFWDYFAFAAYFVVLCGIGLWAGRKEKTRSDDYFLAGRSLPWYVVGGSFIASNISAEQFIGMISAAFVAGICVAMWEWGNVLTFSILIWFLIPFLLASKVFTTPEFMERRFNRFLRRCFAVITVITNVLAFLAAVLYGGGVALQSLFGWPLWFAILALGVVAGSWAIYGGLRSVAWTDLFTVFVMVVGGLLVTVLGLYSLSGDDHSLVEGWRVMIERNRADEGIWQAAVARTAPEIVHADEYDRLSVIQPSTHYLLPWPSLIFMVFTISIWYNVINQFMIQRVLGAKNAYHARMGIVMAGYLKILMPAIVIVPGLILFARSPELMQKPWADLTKAADRGYVVMLTELIDVGWRGLFLAALFGAIQSTINSVLNSTATIFTMDIYKDLARPNASERHLVRVGMWSSVAVLGLSMLLAGGIGWLGKGLFEYVQSLYAFFAPPFGAVFLMGILFRRINGAGATAGVVMGFGMTFAIKAYVAWSPSHPVWMEAFMNQAILNWLFSVAVCVVVSLATAPPRPEQVTDQLTLNWRRLNILEGLGTRWYTHVLLWWGLFAVIIIGLILVFSGVWL